MPFVCTEDIHTSSFTDIPLDHRHWINFIMSHSVVGIIIWLCVFCLMGTSFEILTNQNDFQIKQNNETKIEFVLQFQEVDPNDMVEIEITISKQHPCFEDVDELIFIGHRLTPKARNGISVETKDRSTDQTIYTVWFPNVQESDKGTYIVSVLRRFPDRYEYVKNRTINLVGQDGDLGGTCDSVPYCDITPWQIGFALTFVLLVIAIVLVVFLLIRLLQIIGETEEEDIYVLGNIGSTSRTANTGLSTMGPQGLYEDMDEDGDRRASRINQSTTNDDGNYMIPGDEDGDKVSQLSQPEDDINEMPRTEADAGPSDAYDVPKNVLQSPSAEDNLESVPGNDNNRNSAISMTLPSHYQRSDAPDTAAIADPYERIKYGRYARRFRRIGKCNIL